MSVCFFGAICSHEWMVWGVWDGGRFGLVVWCLEGRSIVSNVRRSNAPSMNCSSFRRMTDGRHHFDTLCCSLQHHCYSFCSGISRCQYR